MLPFDKPLTGWSCAKSLNFLHNLIASQKSAALREADRLLAAGNATAEDDLEQTLDRALSCNGEGYNSLALAAYSSRPGRSAY